MRPKLFFLEVPICHMFRFLHSPFLPSAKPSGPRIVRVVGVGGGARPGSHPKENLYCRDIEMVLKFNFFFAQGRVYIFLPSSFPTHNFLQGGINQDLWLFDQISLRGGIRCSLFRFLFGVGSLSSELSR